MEINSGFKTFDRQANKGGVFSGNAITDVQTSTYVRPHSCTTTPSNKPCPPGEMQKWDLSKGTASTFPEFVKEKIRELATTEQVIAYEFFYRRDVPPPNFTLQKKAKVIVGYAITRAVESDHELLWVEYMQNTRKAIAAMATVISVISGNATKPTHIPTDALHQKHTATLPKLSVSVWR